MAVVRTAGSLSEALEVVEMDLSKGSDDSTPTLVLTSFHIRKDQKLLVEELARRAGESQATIMRAIIDEWIALRLKER